MVGTVFFLLLFFAALTSAISLLEVVASSFIDLKRWSRPKAVGITGTVIFLFGIPSALSGGDLFGAGVKKWVAGAIPPLAANVGSFLDFADYIASNWMLPLGGLLIAIYTGWFMPKEIRSHEFNAGWKNPKLELVWSFALRFIAPVAVTVAMAYVTGIFKWVGLMS